MNRQMFLFTTLLLLAGTAYGATASLTTTVNRLLSHETAFGGCMARLSDRPNSTGLNCKGFFVSFSCTGNFASLSAANRNFELAQIALLTDATVLVSMDDSRKHNGYCFVNRIDLFP